MPSLIRRLLLSSAVLAAAVAAGQPARASYLSLTPATSGVRPGDTVTLTLNLVIDQTQSGFEGLGSVQFGLVFDATKVALSNAALGASLVSFNQNNGNAFSFLSNLENTSGRARVTITDDSGLGAPLAVGNYQLFTIRARVFDNPTPGPIVVDLRQSLTVGSNTLITLVEDVNASRLTLNPGPLNGIDPRDAMLTVVPEPASLVLTLVGGLSLPAAARARRRSR